MISVFLVLLSGALIGVCFGLMVRNNQVFNYRQEILEEVSAAASLDIKDGRDWTWRYLKYTSVHYDDMLYQFWRPLDSFYGDMSFTRPGERKQ